MSAPFRRILVATDFSPSAERALEAARELGQSFGGELHLVHAFDMPVPMFNPYAVTVPVDFVKESREAAERRLDEAAARLREAGLDVQTHLAEVPAASAIVRVAEEVNADLIVMGTRGLTGIKHALLGSVAERTARTAPCSVLAVKSGYDE